MRIDAVGRAVGMKPWGCDAWLPCRTSDAETMVAGPTINHPTRPDAVDAVLDRSPVMLAPDAWLLPGFALAADTQLIAAVEDVAKGAPLRHWRTPGGLAMSVAMTNCGSLGWISDRRGYHYERHDPASDMPWPPMPTAFADLAAAAAEAGGYPGFVPNACLINHYAPGARMALHQDKDERDFSWPIVSASLGLSAVFLLGGDVRSAKPIRIALHHGDVVVWGGAARLRYHGVLPIKAGHHELLGATRINLTFRRAA